MKSNLLFIGDPIEEEESKEINQNILGFVKKSQTLYDRS